MITNFHANRERKNPVPSYCEGATTNCRVEDEFLSKARSNLNWILRERKNFFQEGEIMYSIYKI